MTDAALTKFQNQLSGARAFMGLAMPFYGSLFAHMRVFATDEIPTACVSADDKIRINPEFFDKCGSTEKRAFLLSHEVLHPALGIFQRGRQHYPLLSNIAHDYVINLILKEEKADWVLADALLDEKYKGMCYEEVYGLLKEEAKQQAKSQGQSLEDALSEAMDSGDGNGQPQQTGKPTKPGKGQPGGVLDCPMKDVDHSAGGKDGKDQKGNRLTAAELDAKAKEWSQRVISADLAAKAQGRQSLGAARALGLLGRSQVSWQELLRLAVAEKNNRSRLDWSRPSRRSGALGVFNPREEMLGSDCTIYVDTSGSISPDNLEAAVTEIAEIMLLAGGKIRWLEGDAVILKDEWINQTPDKLDGGGGTSFVPLFDHLRDTPTKLLVIFTDTDGAMPDFTPPYPVIWAVYENKPGSLDNREVPFGEIIPVPAHALV